MFNDPLRIFIGVDARQPLAFTVLANSIYRTSSRPVAITPLVIGQLPITRQGLTEFTFSRYLVPWLCGYKGRAVFLDADCLVLGDIAELFELPQAGLTVAQHGPRFEWPAVMVFGCSECIRLTPEYIDDAANAPQAFDWVERVENLPPEWHYIVGYDEPRDDAKLVHYTAGIPEWRETHGITPEQYISAWYRDKAISHTSVSWLELMGKSVHAKQILERFLA